MISQSNEWEGIQARRTLGWSLFAHQSMCIRNIRTDRLATMGAFDSFESTNQVVRQQIFAICPEFHNQIALGILAANLHLADLLVDHMNDV